MFNLSNKKAFCLGLFGTLAVILPIYLIFAALSFTTNKVAPVEKNQLSVPIARPGPQDAKSVLIICENENGTPTSFVITRFDALENKIVAVSFLPQTIVLNNGKPVSLQKATEIAGPAQAVMCINETLGIKINNFILTTPQNLADMMQPLGIANVLLANYISEEALVQLKLSVEGIENIALTPQSILEVLSSGHVLNEQLSAIRGDSYLAFLRAGSEKLHELLINSFKKYSGKVKTDISATDVYEYERVFKFLDEGEPTFKTIVLSGTLIEDRFELNETAKETAIDYLM